MVLALMTLELIGNIGYMQYWQATQDETYDETFGDSDDATAMLDGFLSEAQIHLELGCKISRLVYGDPSRDGDAANATLDCYHKLLNVLAHRHPYGVRVRLDMFRYEAYIDGYEDPLLQHLCVAATGEDVTETCDLELALSDVHDFIAVLDDAIFDFVHGSYVRQRTIIRQMSNFSTEDVRCAPR